MTTPVAAAAPEFLTVIVYVRFVPALTGLGEASLVTLRSLL